MDVALWWSLLLLGVCNLFFLWSQLNQLRTLYQNPFDQQEILLDDELVRLSRHLYNLAKDCNVILCIGGTLLLTIILATWAHEIDFLYCASERIWTIAAYFLEILIILWLVCKEEASLLIKTRKTFPVYQKTLRCGVAFLILWSITIWILTLGYCSNREMIKTKLALIHIALIGVLTFVVMVLMATTTRNWILIHSSCEADSHWRQIVMGDLIRCVSLLTVRVASLFIWYIIRLQSNDEQRARRDFFTKLYFIFVFGLNLGIMSEHSSIESWWAWCSDCSLCVKDDESQIAVGDCSHCLETTEIEERAELQMTITKATKEDVHIMEVQGHFYVGKKSNMHMIVSDSENESSGEYASEILQSVSVE